MVSGLAMWEIPEAADARTRQGYRRRLRHYVGNASLREIIDACLTPDRDQRPSAAQLATALAAPAALPLAPVAPPEVTAPPTQAAPPSRAGPLVVARRHPDVASAARAGPSVPKTTPQAGGAGEAGHPGRRPVRDRPSARRLIRRSGAMAGVVALTISTAAGLAWLHAYSGNAGRTGDSSGPAMTATVVAVSPAPPQLPAGAATETADGASVAGQYWFEALSYAVGTGNTAALRSTSDPACDACTAVENAIANAYRAGGSLRGGQYVVRSINLDSFFNLQRATFRVVFDRGPRATLDAAGRERASLAQATFAPCQIILGFAGGQWRVLAVQSPDPVG
jgi:hypothetical protein